MYGMAKETYRDLLAYLFREAGFRPARQCYLNYRFSLAMLAGLLVVWVMLGWVKPYPAEFKIGLVPLLSLIIWQPLVEEVLFRGIIQGQFAKHDWGKRSWLNISGANVAASVLFAAIHLINGSPLFAFSVIAPSLVFGYFRDYYNSVYPSIIIHSTYNAMVFAGLILYGNMNFPSF